MLTANLLVSQFTVHCKLLPAENWSFFKGDRVEVLVGKDKGKQGIIKQVIQERNWVIVEGLNWHYRKIADDSSYAGVMIKSEAPLLVQSPKLNFKYYSR